MYLRERALQVEGITVSVPYHIVDLRDKDPPNADAHIIMICTLNLTFDRGSKSSNK